MTRVYLVRHGRAAAGWDTDPDPGLDELGRRQAADTAERLSALAPMAVVSSPLRRCRETASFLMAHWGLTDLPIADDVREIPSPPGIPMNERVEWLRRAMAGSWGDLGSPYVEFRDSVVSFVATRPVDTVIFSHFIAINAVVGSCLGDDRLVIDSLDNASVTVVETGHGSTGGTNGLRLVERGRQADTLIR
ncbi:MAG: hypothetical protein RLZZ269_736 [Actinomycetota bacterium]